MLINSSVKSPEVNLATWMVQMDDLDGGMKHLVASNFQDIFNMTKRISEVEVKMNKLKFRTQGIGGMIGIAAGAMGGPLGSIIGFGIGRSIGGYVGNVMSKRYYGEEQAVINENLALARSRDGQLKFMMGELDGLGSMITTIRQNQVSDDKKILQDMMVL